jgi:hypothetical protein
MARRKPARGAPEAPEEEEEEDEGGCRAAAATAASSALREAAKWPTSAPRTVKDGTRCVGKRCRW